MVRCLRFCAWRSKLARLDFGGSSQFFTRSTNIDAPKYRAFISYSHRDSVWASWLHSSLEKYRSTKSLIGTVTARGEVPKRIAPIFRDRDELPSATDLGSLINAALADSACQIVICSPQAAQSKWVNEEILAFKRLGREDRIFCLIVGGEPNATDIPSREQEECFPPALRFRLGPDGGLSVARTEPIAADARPGKDGKSNAKLAEEPAMQARLMDTLGTVYMGLGLFNQARPLIDRAVSTRRSLQNVDPLDLSDSLSHQADLLGLQAEYDASEKAYREAIRIDSARRRPAH
jgi:hypothetical protein